jgi:hypothetical protein
VTEVNHRDIRLFVEFSPSWQGYHLRVVAHDYENNTYGLTDEGWKPVEPGWEVPVLLFFKENQAQALMNSLWGVGLRPGDLKESGTALEATKYHLEDMRKLAFSLFERDVEHV